MKEKVTEKSFRTSKHIYKLRTQSIDSLKLKIQIFLQLYLLFQRYFRKYALLAVFSIAQTFLAFREKCTVNNTKQDR